MMNTNFATKCYGILVLIFAGCLISALVRLGSYYDTHYERQAEVVKTDGNIITVMDTCGYVWTFEGEGYSESDIVTLKMYNNCTDDIIKDDEILSVKFLTVGL